MQKQVEVTVQLKFQVNENLTVNEINDEITLALQDVLHTINSDCISADTDDVRVTEVYVPKVIPVINLDSEDADTGSSGTDITEPYYPNGSDSWKETHFELFYHLFRTKDIKGSMANQVYAKSGRGGLYELSNTLTGEFETKFKGKVWDGDFSDEIDKFLDDRNKGFRQKS